MSWFPDSIVGYPVSGSELGLIVRPIGAGVNGAVPVQLAGSSGSGSLQVSGSVSVSNLSDIRDVNVGYLLGSILMELRYVNFHLSKMTGIEDVESEIDAEEDSEE